jgi:hypothetical protein
MLDSASYRPRPPHSSQYSLIDKQLGVVQCVRVWGFGSRWCYRCSPQYLRRYCCVQMFASRVELTPPNGLSRCRWVTCQRVPLLSIKQFRYCCGFSQFVSVPHAAFATKLGLYSSGITWLHNGTVCGELVNLTVENTPNSMPNLEGRTMKCSTSRNCVGLRMPSSMRQQSLLYRLYERRTAPVGKEGISFFLLAYFPY